MATIWTKKTPGLPWKDAETGDYLIIAELTPSMAQGSIPGTDIEFHEQIALQNAQDNFYEYYAANLVAVGQGDSIPSADKTFEVVTKNGVKQKHISPRPNGSALYLIRYTGGTGDPKDIPQLPRQSITAFSSSNPGVDTSNILVFDSYNDFAKMMELVAKKLEEYDKQLKEDNPDGMNYSGPALLGYGKFDFLAEAESLRKFYTEIFDLFKRNNVPETVPFQMLHSANLISDELLLGQGLERYLIQAIVSFEENGNGYVFNGTEYFFGGKTRWRAEFGSETSTLPGREPFTLPRTANFIINLSSIVNIMLSGYGADSIDDINVGPGCSLPPLAAKEEPMPLLSFMENGFVQPKPILLFSLQGDPIKVFDKLAKQNKPVVKKSEKDSIEKFIKEDLLREAVANRTKKADEYVGDFVFESLPSPPNDFRELKTIDDVYAYILNRIDIPTIAQEAMACLGLVLSIEDLLDIACDKLLRAVFGDIKRLEKLIEFMESGDPLLGTAFAAAGLDQLSNVDAGGSIDQLTNDLRNFIAGEIDTGNDVADQFFTEETLGAFDGDIKATKRFICEVLIIGPFVGLAALIALIKRLRQPEKPQPPEIPPFKKCEPGFTIPDNIPILDRLLQYLIDLALEKAEELLMELIIQPLKELLENLFAACRDDDEFEYGTTDLDDFPYDDDVFDAYTDNLPEDFNVNDFLNGLFASLTPNELCSLYKGEATEDLLKFVLDHFKNNTPENSSFSQINTLEKVVIFFIDLGEKTDLSRCDELSEETDRDLDRTLIDLCDDGTGFRERMMAQALMRRGLTIEEIEEQLSQTNEMNKDVAGSLLDLLSAADRAAEIEIDMSDAMKDSIKGPVLKTLEGMFGAVERQFLSEMTLFVPLVSTRKLNLMRFLGLELIESTDPSTNNGLFRDILNDQTGYYHTFALTAKKPILLPYGEGIKKPITDVYTPFTTSAAKGAVSKYEVRFRFLKPGVDDPWTGGAAQSKTSIEIYDVEKGATTAFGTYVIDSSKPIAVTGFNGLHAETLTGKSITGDSPTEPQLFELMVDFNLLQSFDDLLYREDLRRILTTEENTARADLFGLIFRDMLRTVAERIDAQVELAQLDNVFRQLDFFKETTDLYNLSELREQIAEDFSSEVSKTNFENSSDAPTLFDYLVDWPTAGATRAMIKLFAVEVTLKSILSIVITRPDQLLDSELFSTYLTGTIEEKIWDFAGSVLTGVKGINLRINELPQEELTKIIKDTVKDTSDAVTEIMGDQFINYRLTEDAATKPPIVSYPEIYDWSEKRYSTMPDDKKHNSYDMVHGLVVNKGKGDNIMDWKMTQFTNPRFFAFDYSTYQAPDMKTSGFVLEKCVRYKLYDKKTMRTGYLLSNLTSDDSVWQALANDIENLSMELIGRGTTVDEILGPNRPMMELSYNDFNTKWNMELFNSHPVYQNNLRSFFEEIEIGYRLSYVFPEDVAGEWWETPLAGAPDKFWDRFKEYNLDRPSLRPAEKFRSVPFMDMKIDKAFFMREAPLDFENEPLADLEFTNWPKVFVLPFVTVGVSIKVTNSDTMKKIGNYFGGEPGWESNADRLGWNKIKETFEYKTLFNFIFPIDKILSLISIRNSISFDLAMASIDEECLGTGHFFSLTEETIMNLIRQANRSKEIENLHDLSKGDTGIQQYKKELKSVIDMENKSPCRSKFDLMGIYNDNIVIPEGG